MDVKQIKKDFPIFTNRPTMTYLDNAATTQKPRKVIHSLVNFYELNNFNVHRSVYTPSQKTTNLYEGIRKQVANFLGSRYPNSVIFTHGTTDSINEVAYGYFRHRLKPGDEIVISIMEHHSNLLPWQRLAKQTGAKLRYIPVTSQSNLDLAKANRIISQQTKLVALTGVSNVLGTINPVSKISQIAHLNHALFLLDAAQMAPEIPIDVKKIHPDFVAFSGHKMLGPTGIGILYINPKLLRNCTPVQLGGEMIRNVTTQNFTYASVPQRFEAGTPDVAGVIGLGSAIEYLSQLSMAWIQERCAELGQYLYDQLSQVTGVIIYGPQKRQTGIVSFNLKGIHPHDVATALDINQIYVRAGQHCAQPLVNRCLKTSATVRASLYFYNTKSDCNRLVDCIRKVVKFFYAAQGSLSEHHRR